MFKNTLATLYTAFFFVLLSLYFFAKTEDRAQRPAQEISPAYQHLQRSTIDINQDVVDSSHVTVEIRISWTDAGISHVFAVFPKTPNLVEVQAVITALNNSILRRIKQSPSSYQTIVIVQNEEKSFLRILLAWLAFGWGLVFLGKIKDSRIKGGSKEGLKPYKQRFERYFRALANQNFKRMLHRAILTANEAVISLFGPRIFSLKGLGKFILFSLVLNLYLSYVPLVSALPSHAVVIMFEDIKSFLVPLATCIVNLPLDLLAYIMTRRLLQQGLRGKLPGILSVLGVLIVGWFFAGLSTAAGAPMTSVVLSGNPFNLVIWQQVVFPLIAHWYSAGILDPFQSNLKINNLNMGYVALGALPTCVLLLSALVSTVLWRRFPLIIVGELRRYLNLIIKDDKSHFELLGYVATIIPLFLALLIRQIFIFMNGN